MISIIDRWGTVLISSPFHFRNWYNIICVTVKRRYLAFIEVQEHLSNDHVINILQLIYTTGRLYQVLKKSFFNLTTFLLLDLKCIKLVCYINSY